MNSNTCVAVICEFNPMHNGHEYLIKQIRRQHHGATVLCLMSGNYVQRGEPAIADKYLRAKIAILNGADLVLELPIPYCISSAECFAKGAVEILTRLNGVDHLYFGSECADIQRLRTVAENLNDPDFQTRVSQRIRADRRLSYPVAVEKEYAVSFPDGPDLPKTPNDILGLHYLRAILSLNSSIQPHAFARHKIDHDSPQLIEGFCSSTALREIVITKGMTSAAGFMSASTLEAMEKAKNDGLFPIDPGLWQRLLFNDLRNRAIQGEDFDQYLHCQGLGPSIRKSLLNARDLKQVYQGIKNKSLTLSGVRRTILGAYLRIPEQTENQSASYTLVLGISPKGKRFLSSIRKKKSVTVITKPADILQLSKNNSLARVNVRADSMYCSFYPDAQPWDRFIKTGPYIGEE